MNNPNQQQINIDFSKTTEEICERCENNTFQQVYQMRKLSALLAPNGQEALIPVQTYACAKCGHINKGMQPKE